MQTGLVLTSWLAQVQCGIKVNGTHTRLPPPAGLAAAPNYSALSVIVYPTDLRYHQSPVFEPGFS